MKFAAGMLTVILAIAIAVGIDPMVSVHVWCAVTQNPRCF